MAKKLNIGCGKDYREGWINLDIDRNVKADVRHNLDKYPYPFKDKEFDVILASHIVEHLESPIRFFKEMERVMKDKSELHVIVPHFTNPMAYTPVHKTFYSYKTVKHALTNLKVREIQILFTPKYRFMEIFAVKFPVFY